MEPYEIFMLGILVVLEVPAVVILALGWVRACKEARKDDEAKDA